MFHVKHSDAPERLRPAMGARVPRTIGALGALRHADVRVRPRETGETPGDISRWGPPARGHNVSRDTFQHGRGKANEPAIPRSARSGEHAPATRSAHLVSRPRCGRPAPRLPGAWWQAFPELRSTALRVEAGRCARRAAPPGDFFDRLMRARLHRHEGSGNSQRLYRRKPRSALLPAGRTPEATKRRKW
jgi:hypothetical protein